MVQLIANGTQGPASIPTKQTPSGMPGYAYSLAPGVIGAQTILDADVFNTILAELVNVITAAGLSPDASNNGQVAAAIPVLAAGRLINIQKFTPAGTYTYTPTAGTKKVEVTVVGGGGGSGGSLATGGTTVSLGGGGGGGARGDGLITSAFAGVTITVGAGGSAGAAGGPGGNGGPSSFGAIISAPGGNGGAVSPAVVPIIVSPGVNGGATASGGNLTNQPGAPSIPGISTATASSMPSVGGNAPGFGTGGPVAANATVAGTTGASPGSGANGAVSLASSSAQIGAVGAAGIVIVREYA